MTNGHSKRCMASAMTQAIQIRRDDPAVSVEAFRGWLLTGYAMRQVERGIDNGLGPCICGPDDERATGEDDRATINHAGIFSVTAKDF